MKRIRLHIHPPADGPRRCCLSLYLSSQLRPAAQGSSLCVLSPIARPYPPPPPPRTAGNYGALRKAGKKDKAKTHMEMLAAVKNYR